jgi:hypothetical protein
LEKVVELFELSDPYQRRHNRLLIALSGEEKIHEDLDYAD